MGNQNNCDSSTRTTVTPNTNDIKINVDIRDFDGAFKGKCVIHSRYAKEQKMRQILKEITKHLNHTYYPIKYKINIESESFTGYTNEAYITDLENKSITEYDINEIKNRGLIIHVRVPTYYHRVSNVLITCPEMKRLGSEDAMKCSVYCEMKENSNHCAENLYHLDQYTHLTDEYGAKTECRHKDECNAYKRLENGGNALNDKCHMKMYRHP
eukprot:67241_1